MQFNDPFLLLWHNVILHHTHIHIEDLEKILSYEAC